jgi:outer membrane protein TolC
MKLVAVVMLAALILGGCAGFSKDGGLDVVGAATQAHLGKEIAWPKTEQELRKVRDQVNALLSHPLAVDDAVQIALLNSRSLQAQFEELGISESDWVQSGRMPNPRFDLRHASAAGQVDIEATLSFDFLALLTMPYAQGIERRRFEQTQDAVLLQVLQLAKDTRESFFATVTAQESLEYQQEIQAAAKTSAELALRMVAAGNWNQIDQSHERIFLADAAMNFSHAKLAEVAARERLTRLLGLVDRESPGQPTLQLAQHLPELPAQIEALPDVEAAIVQNRIDLRLMRAQLDELAHRLKLTRATRFINVLEAGPVRVRQGTRQEPHESGYAITVEIPIFDSGAARLRKSEAIYAQAVDRFAQAAIDARSQIRQAYAGYAAGFDLARELHDDVVPLRKSIAEQNLLRYNASLISIFELLADAREQIVSVGQYLQSLRDFWIARSELDSALLGSSAP